jgi:hypothetical protein
MPEPVKITKAELRELSPDGKEVPNSSVPVQFNPETLKVSYSNQVKPPEKEATDQRSTAAMQYVGKGSTKMSVQLWFDVTSLLPESHRGITDVRKLTEKVVFFIKPKETGDPEKQVPPGVRFLWGTFKFDGIVESLEESLEFFSPEGKPLRASVTIGLIQQTIQFEFNEADSGGGLGFSMQTPGTQPLTQAVSGSTIQSLAASAGKGGNWQEIAARNGIENPRLLQPGRLINMNTRG